MHSYQYWPHSRESVGLEHNCPKLRQALYKGVIKQTEVSFSCIFFLLLINYFDNVMTEIIVNNRTSNCVLYDNKLPNCPLSLLDMSHKLQFHVSLRLLTIKISQ